MQAGRVVMVPRPTNWRITMTIIITAGVTGTIVAGTAAGPSTTASFACCCWR